MKPVVLLAISAAVLANCAANPEDIAAADIGTGMYRGQSCEQLAEQRLAYTQRLEALSAEQSSARTGDTVGVILLGLPLSSMSGNDRETDIAVTRGHLNEIDRERLASNCA